MCGAYILYTAVLGVYAFWGPKAGKRIFDLAGETADLVFGGVTVITGVFGSLIGGLLLDWLGSTLSNANLVCGLGQLFGLVLLIPAFLWAKNFTLFIVLFALGELGLFTLQAPVAAIGMWCVPTALRPLAISMVTVSIHLLGDVPSPPLVGALQSALEQGKTGAQADAQWRITMSVASSLLFLSGCVFLRGSQISKAAADYRKAEELEAAAATAEHHHLHLPRHHDTHGDEEGQQPAATAAAGADAYAGDSRPQGPGSITVGGWVGQSVTSPPAERQPLLPQGPSSGGGSS
jgi:MFS family permease